MNLISDLQRNSSFFNQSVCLYPKNSLTLIPFDLKSIPFICRIYHAINHSHLTKKTDIENLGKGETYILLSAYTTVLEESQKLLALNEETGEFLQYYQQVDDKLGRVSREQKDFSTTLKHRITIQMRVMRKLAKVTDALPNNKELTREEELRYFQSHLENVRIATILKKEYQKEIETLTKLHEELTKLKISLPSSSLLRKVFNISRKVLGRVNEKEAVQEKLGEAKKSLQKRLDSVKKSINEDLTFFKAVYNEISNLFDAENIEEIESFQILNILDRDPEGIAFQKEMYKELSDAEKTLYEEGWNGELLREQERTFSIVFYLDDFLQDKEEVEWQLWKSRLEPLRQDIIGFLKRAGSNIPFLTSSTQEILEHITLNSWHSLPVYQELILERSESEQREIFSEIERGRALFNALTTPSIQMGFSKEQLDKQVRADLLLQFISWSSHIHWNREIHQKILDKAALGDDLSFEKGSLEDMRHHIQAKQSFARAVSGWERVSGGLEEIQRGSQTFVQALIKKEQEVYQKKTYQTESSLDSSFSDLKKDTDLFHTQLVKGVKTSSTVQCAVDPFHDWIEQVQGLCFDLTLIEAQITAKMEKARPLINRKIENKKELDDYGGKHKHLVMQSQLLEVLNIEGITIPIPHGISNTKLTKFIRQFAPKVFKHWEDLKALFKAYTGSRSFLESVESTHLLEAISEELIVAFSKPNEELFDIEFIRWIKTIEEAGEYLMVRSTGAEDSRQLANAGGNVSKAYVLPKIGAITQAIGQVIASYFSRNSLQNRINAGFNPFEEELKIAVTTQRLIGEPIGGASHSFDIPISLVLFTNEPLYIGSEKFRVMRLSATYGHGEGVVGNLGIASDTVLILQSALHPDRIYILYDNQPKEERLAPIVSPVGTKLSKLPNPKEIVHERALSNQMLARLFNWGIIAEKYFDNVPTDMEIVIKGETIYPVQARPVNRPSLLPTYFDRSQATDLTPSSLIQTIQVSTIVPGFASVMLISEESEILFAETLEQAERFYRKDFHQIVITSRTEPANSHPVVNFSSLGVACLHSKEIEQVKELAKKITVESPLVICIQSGTLTLWDSSKGDVRLFIQKGFTVHPAKISFSFPLGIPFTFKKEVETSLKLKNLILRLRSAETQEAAQPILFALGEQVLLIKRQVDTLSAELKTIPHKLAFATDYLKALEVISEQAEQSLGEMGAVVGRGRLERLFHAKVVERTFIHSEDDLYSFAIEDVSSLITSTKQLIAYQKALPHRAYLAQEFVLGIQEAPFQELAQIWKNFLLEIELEVYQGRIFSSEVVKFKEWTKWIYQTGTFPTWLLMIVSPQISSKSSSTAFRDLLKSFSSEDKIVLEEVQTERQKLKNLRREMALLSNPESYSKFYQNLIETSLFYLDQEELDRSLGAKRVSSNSAIQNSKTLSKIRKSPIIHVILIQLMNEFVDIFDTFIKKVKIEPHFSDEVKVEKIKELLLSYFALLKYWSTKIILSSKIPNHYRWPLEAYLHKEENLLRGRSNEIFQLRPSNRFSVAAAKLGSKVLFDNHLPQTLEDDFTLIHQNLLACLASLTNELLSSEFDRGWPSEVSLAVNEIEKLIVTVYRSITVQPNLVGIEITKEKVNLSFNMPLRNHSSQLVLSYDFMKKTMNLQIYFMGEGIKRWKDFASVIRFLDKSYLLSLDEPLKQTDMALHATWRIESNLNLALIYFKNAVEMSLIYTEKTHINQLDKLFEASSFALQWNRAFLENEEFFQTYSIPYDRMLLLFIQKKLSVSSLKELAKVLFWSKDQVTNDLIAKNLILEMQTVIWEYPKQKRINPTLEIEGFLTKHLSNIDYQIIVLDLFKKHFGDTSTTVIPAFIELFEIYLKNPFNTIEDAKKEWIAEWMDALLKDSITSHAATRMIHLLLRTPSGAHFMVNYINHMHDSDKRELTQKIRELLYLLSDDELLKVLINLVKNRFLLEEAETFLIAKYRVWLLEKGEIFIPDLIRAGYIKGAKEAATFYLKNLGPYPLSFISKIEFEALNVIYSELVSRGESIEEAFLFLKIIFEFCETRFLTCPHPDLLIKALLEHDTEFRAMLLLIEILKKIEKISLGKAHAILFRLSRSLFEPDRIGFIVTSIEDLLMSDAEIKMAGDPRWEILDSLLQNINGFSFLKKRADDAFISGNVEQAVHYYLLFAKRAKRFEKHRFLQKGSISAQSYQSLLDMGQMDLAESLLKDKSSLV